MSGMVRVVHAREPIPVGKLSIFLAGPTPRDPSVPSWRPAALRMIADSWTGRQPVHVLVPELIGPWDGDRVAQFSWETAARARADVILYWLWRDLATLPGFTTNVEFGLDAPTGKAVLGAPPDCPNPERNGYLVRVAGLHGVPVCETLADTVETVLSMIGSHR